MESTSIHQSEDRGVEDLRPMVYQANPLVEAKRDMDTTAMRLYYLALRSINPHLSEKDKFYDHELPVLHLTPLQVEQIFGNWGYLDKIKKACNTLIEAHIEVESKDGRNFDVVSVFDKIEYREKSGLRIRFNQSMKPYILDLVQQHGYTRINAKQMFSLGSVYAMRLLELMLEYQGLKKNHVIQRRIELSRLRFMLGISSEKYKDITNFQRRVLIEPMNEINRKTLYKMSYKPIRIGRKIGAFDFSLDTSDMDVDLQNVPDNTVSVEMLPSEKEWHGLSRKAVNKLTLLCGNNEEFRRRMSYALSILPQRKPKNVQAFLYKAIEENYRQQDLDMQKEIQEEMQRQLANQEWILNAKEVFGDAIPVNPKEKELPFPMDTDYDRASVYVIKKTLKEGHLSGTVKRILTEHNMSVPRFLDIYVLHQEEI